MNPDLTKQISERLSKLHDTQVNAAPAATTVQMTTETHGDLVTISANGHPIVELSSMYRGAIPGQAVVLTANSGPKSAFDLQVGDGVLIGRQPPISRSYASFSDAAAMTSGLAHLHHTKFGLDLNVPEEERAEHVTLRSPSENELAASTGDEIPSDEIDDEFWKSMGMTGPQDMTPDKLAEISKKLQEFGRNLKRMQREHPSTMGVAVRIKSRTPKKRKRKH